MGNLCKLAAGDVGILNRHGLMHAVDAEIEKIIHKQIDRLTDLRIRQNREFFNVHPDQALEILLDLAEAFDDAVVMKYEDGKPYQV